MDLHKLFVGMLVFGLSGMGIEVLFTAIRARIKGFKDPALMGESYAWMFVPYSLLPVMYLFINTYLWHHALAVRGVLYMSFIFVTEYSYGYLLRKFIGECPWNYTEGRHVDGLINMSYAPLWFVFGIIGEKFYLALR